jgi:pimeloyl-ACP methyl ester carboxylesterase
MNEPAAEPIGIETAFSEDVRGNAICGLVSAGGNPGFVWLGGFRSDMDGTKAQSMVSQAQATGCATLRFDYSGHGWSGGKFEDGTISLWVDEALTIICTRTDGPQVLVGSSMGAWVALRVLARLKEVGEEGRIAGLLLIAPAPDFTSELMEPSFTNEQRAAMDKDGFISEPSAYSDEPNIITRALIEDGRENRVLVPGLHLGCPVRILQGTADPDVPVDHARRLVELLAQDEVIFTLVKDGDHRLSRDEDIDLLCRTIADMADNMAIAQ